MDYGTVSSLAIVLILTIVAVASAGGYIFRDQIQSILSPSNNNINPNATYINRCISPNSCSYPAVLVGEWKFDEVTGTIASDSINGNNGTLFNGSSICGNPPTSSGPNFCPTWTTGKSGGALSFDGVDDYVVIPNSANMNPPVISISAWVYVPTLRSSTTLVSKGATGGEEYVFDFFDLSSGCLSGCSHNIVPRFFLRKGTGQGTLQECDSNTSISTNTWNFLAATYDGNIVRIYQNGINYGPCDFRSIAIPTGSLFSNTNNVIIGARELSGGGFGFNFAGTIADVRIYNGTLSASQVQTIYSSG